MTAGYLRPKALRAASETEAQGREIKRLRQWMEELRQEVEVLRHDQQRTEEAIYEQLVELPTARRGAEETESHGPALQGDVEGLRSQVLALEAELEVARRDRDGEREHAAALQKQLAEHVAAEELRLPATRRIESLLADQEKHMQSVVQKLSRLDAQLIGARDAERADPSTAETLPFDPSAATHARELEPPKRWRRIQALFTATDI